MSLSIRFFYFCVETVVIIQLVYGTQGSGYVQHRPKLHFCLSNLLSLRIMLKSENVAVGLHIRVS
jgi:hypothetical protein